MIYFSRHKKEVICFATQYIFDTEYGLFGGVIEHNHLPKSKEECNLQMSSKNINQLKNVVFEYNGWRIIDNDFKYNKNLIKLL